MVENKLHKPFTTPDENYQHFSKRLNERFGITIDKAEYKKLCRSHVSEHLYKQNERTQIAVMCIKGQNAIVVAKNAGKQKERVLLTCWKNDLLTELEQMPLPTEVVPYITKDEFWREVREIIEESKKLVDEYKLNPVSRKEYFTTFPYNYDETIHKIAWSIMEGKECKVGKTIRYVVKRVKEQVNN